MNEVTGARVVIRKPDGTVQDILEQDFGHQKRLTWLGGNILAQFSRETITRAMMDGNSVEVEPITKDGLLKDVLRRERELQTAPE